jgi:hypothetical protein
MTLTLASDIAIRPDHRRRPIAPAVVQAAGCASSMLLMLAAAMPSALALSVAANAALLLFAAINLRRPYRRFWAPALCAMAIVALLGMALALLPPAETAMASLTRFGLDGLRNAAQLGAVAMTAFAWSSAGRSPRRMRVSAGVVAALAALQLAAAMHSAIAGASIPDWQLPIDWLFALWLLATAMGLAQRQRGRL